MVFLFLFIGYNILINYLVDHHVPVLKRMFEKRKSGYKAMGYIVASKQVTTTTDQMKLF